MSTSHHDISALLREIRQDMFDRPQALLGNYPPSIDAFWGYMRGINDAIDASEGRDRRPWMRFLLDQQYENKNEYTIILLEKKEFSDCKTFLQNLYEDFDEWLEEKSTSEEKPNGIYK